MKLKYNIYLLLLCTSTVIAGCRGNATRRTKTGSGKIAAQQQVCRIVKPEELIAKDDSVTIGKRQDKNITQSIYNSIDNELIPFFTGFADFGRIRSFRKIQRKPPPQEVQEMDQKKK
jgi:hypothetical protein